jgi:hypothetical protein
MLRKIGKTTLFATIAATVLLAGTVSARQLRTDYSLPRVCGTTCSATVHCGGLCTCWIDSGQTTGFCAQEPPAAKPKTK